MTSVQCVYTATSKLLLPENEICVSYKCSLNTFPNAFDLDKRFAKSFSHFDIQWVFIILYIWPAECYEARVLTNRTTSNKTDSNLKYTMSTIFVSEYDA